MPLKRKTLAFIALSSSVILAVVWLLMRHHDAAEPATIDHPRLVPGVIMQDVTFFSQALQRGMQYRVFLPENTGGEKLAVVYLLHGGGGTFRDWSNYSNVAEFAASGFLLVMPQGDYSYYSNAALRPQDRYEDYVVDDLPADVERRFPVRADRGGRAIAGVSMGGFGAVKVALRHPDQYAFVGALSPAIDVPRRRFSWRRWNQSNSYREIFGPDGGQTRRANDPFLLIATADPKATPYFYLTCGRQEGLLAPNREFVSLLERYRFAHEFHDVPGGHDWNQWNNLVPGLWESLRNHLSESPGRAQKIFGSRLLIEARRRNYRE